MRKVVRGIVSAGVGVCLAVLPGVVGRLPAGVGDSAPRSELANWPVFRGWGGNGRATGEFAKTWDGKKGENIIWKSKTGLPGNSSPVVWGDKVFMTGGDETNHEVYCYGTADGKLLWTGQVPREGKEKIDMPEEAEEAPPEPGEPEPEISTSGAGWAACTAAVDGKNVYAIFASGEIAAFDFSGKKVWQKYLGKPDSAYGYSSSLTVTGGNVIVQWDMGENEKASASALVAFEGATGKEAWRTKRPGANAWGSPVVSADGKWIVTTGSPWVSAYEAATGAETWRAKLLDNDVSCTPCVMGEVAVIANDHGVMAAMKMAGKGDVTKTGIIWQGEDG
jgi:outer membrane protein assembly factor BamB